MPVVMKFNPLLVVVYLSATLLVAPSSYAIERATEYLRTLEETNISVGLEYDQGDFGTDQTSYYFQVPVEHFLPQE